MPLHGAHIIAGETVRTSGETFQATDPSTGEPLEPGFCEGSKHDVHRALECAQAAAPVYAACTDSQRADFLECIAEEILELGDELIERGMRETGLPEARLIGERGRTVGQITMFATLVREGHWVEASIDHAVPDRQPAPKPDLRRMLIPIGPVAVLGAANFPLAFSVGGGDTASALAAGNPVVVKGHEAHPGTSELVGQAISKAVRATELPSGVFSLIQGRAHEIGMALVQHPATCAVGFTGSLRAGRTLYDAAAARPQPIPVYAEMGSINPVFLLPGAMAERASDIAEGLTGSVTLGAGQFCTSPGLVVALDDPSTDLFIESAKSSFSQAAPATMLHAGIRNAYTNGLHALESVENVTDIASSEALPDPGKNQAAATLFLTDYKTFLQSEILQTEVFGPASLVVKCSSKADLLAVAEKLEGNLTATVHGSEADLGEFAELIDMLRRKVGRIIFNGFPTGVEVCASMQHGGPYPACTFSNATSVGGAAIKRFARPLSYQDFPNSALPAALQEANPLGITRLVDGAWEKNV